MKRVSLLVFVFSLTAVHAEIFKGPMSSALGGAGVAGMPGAEGGLLNPALVPLYKGSGVDAYYRDGYADSGQHRTTMGFGAIDNSPDVWFPGTLHYLQLRDTGRFNQPVSGELWHAAVGEQFDRFAFGVSAYRLIYKIPHERAYTQWNGAIGGLFMIHDGLGVAYVLKNVAKPGSDIPNGLREDLQQVFGVFADAGDFARLRVDIARQEVFNPHHKLAYMAGLESKTSEMMLFRIGYRYDDLADQRVWTAGIGFDGPRLKADYSVEKNQERTGEALHSVDLRLLF